VRTWTDRGAVLVASFGLTGFFPVAPATFASAVVTPLLAAAYTQWPRASEQLLICASLLVIGVWSSGRIERLYGKDPSAAVIDEVLGMAIALAGAPINGFTLVLAFVLFRVLDVLKLPPGRALERLPGGWGIMMDDACAGLYAAIVLQGILRVWPGAALAWWQLVPVGAAAVLLAVFRKPLLQRYGKKRCDPRTGLGVAAGSPAERR
jgi:phosphatidylglycerophosphatase A